MDMLRDGDGSEEGIGNMEDLFGGELPEQGIGELLDALGGEPEKPEPAE